MKRATGIGGIFFKARDPKALAEWYRIHLGVEVQAWGGAGFRWASPDNPSGAGTTENENQGSECSFLRL